MALKNSPGHIITYAFLALLDATPANPSTTPDLCFKGHPQPKGFITTVNSVHDGLAHYPDLGPEDLVVCDVDETLVKHEALPIESKGMPFDQQLLLRKFSLLDNRLPHLFDALHEQKVPIIALTHTRTGPFESIPSMEHWRYNIVNNLGLRFSFDEKKHTFHLTKMPKPYPSFFKGIILTGHHNKGAVLKTFLHKIKKIPKRILFFDDLKSNIDHVHAALAKTHHIHCFHISTAITPTTKSL